MKQKDLKLMYREFRHYFCAEMPEDVPIKITRANSYMGATCRYLDEPYEIAIHFGKPMILWGFKEFPGVVTWESVMLHEMCHIWQWIKLPNDTEAHSPRFMDKLRAIETLTGIPQFWDFTR